MTKFSSIFFKQNSHFSTNFLGAHFYAKKPILRKKKFFTLILCQQKIFYENWRTRDLAYFVCQISVKNCERWLQIGKI